ncbi:YIP1 family protein [Halosegnis marinus]|uniref:YIP1 family protein n=1 Tax=Halosegnis marinus TaxID=3034023 RepID=A0ABD5ZSS8_9EURY|nr:YIP1 family protein [Halosegnis sp. DT85]
MTTWVENPTGGRERGPRGLARAWIEILRRPRRFFANGVAPGDQAPGLTFAVSVALVYVATRFAFLPSARPAFFANEAASVGVGLLVAALIIAPVALHLVAALEVVILIAVVRDRAGVSETVQVIGYATAPMALAGVGVPPALADVALLPEVVAAWRLGLALWGAGLLWYGMATVHDTSLVRAGVAVALPAVIVFGYLFGGVFAFETLTGIEVADTTPPTGAGTAASGDMETQLVGGREPRP